MFTVPNAATWLLAIFAWTACTTAGDPLFEERDIIEIPVGAAIGYEEHIQPLFNTYCNNCHGAAGLGGLKLDTYEGSLEAGVSGNAPIPCDPDNSFLYEKISSATPSSGVQMPMAADALTAEEQQLVYDWLAQGAPRNAGGGNCGGGGPSPDTQAPPADTSEPDGAGDTPSD